MDSGLLPVQRVLTPKIIDPDLLFNDTSTTSNFVFDKEYAILNIYKCIFQEDFFQAEFERSSILTNWQGFIGKYEILYYYQEITTVFINFFLNCKKSMVTTVIMKTLCGAEGWYTFKGEFLKKNGIYNFIFKERLDDQNYEQNIIAFSIQIKIILYHFSKITCEKFCDIKKAKQRILELIQAIDEGNILPPSSFCLNNKNPIQNSKDYILNKLKTLYIIINETKNVTINEHCFFEGVTKSSKQRLKKYVKNNIILNKSMFKIPNNSETNPKCYNIFCAIFIIKITEYGWIQENQNASSKKRFLESEFGIEVKDTHFLNYPLDGLLKKLERLNSIKKKVEDYENIFEDLPKK